MKCTSCGTENPDGSRFCMSCATPLTPTVPAAPASPYPAVAPPPLYRRHRQPHEDLIGLLGLAFVLAAVSVAFAVTPTLPAQLQEWTQSVSASQTVFVRPPEGVIVSAAWFFVAVGLFEFIAAGLRWSFRWTRARVTARILAGAGDLIFAALLSLYSSKTISGPFLIAILAGSVAVLLMIFVVLGLYWASARASVRPGTVEPPAQQ